MARGLTGTTSASCLWVSCLSPPREQMGAEAGGTQGRGVIKPASPVLILPQNQVDHITFPHTWPLVVYSAPKYSHLPGMRARG